MAKESMKELVGRLTADFLADQGLELYNVEFRREGHDWYLRVYIDKLQKEQDGTDVYVSTDDCEKVSRYLSDRLDEEDPIQQNYILEVSSPGMDRQLFEKKDYERFAGRIVDVKLYRNFEGSKEFQGVLLGLRDGCVAIQPEDGAELSFTLEQVAKTSLAVIF